MSTPKTKLLATTKGGRPARRVQDWPTLFFHFIESRRSRPFAWGQQDCCLFACDGILAQTGLDPAAKMFRGKYRDALGAARLVRKHGGVEAIASRICGELGFVEVPVRLAQRGDVVAISGEALGDNVPYMGVALGLCVGGTAAFTGSAGLVFHPLKNCRRAWRVG
jgi:hypothetical protein